MTQNLKILLLDIETIPNIGYTWGKYEQDVIKFVEEWVIVCFAAKWLGSKSTTVKAVSDYKGYNSSIRNDKDILTDIRNMLDEADIVIGHNLDKFDIKKINARMVANGIAPPSPYKTVDTLKVARKYFSFNSNRLNDLGQTLGLGKKVETGGFDLWEGCMKGKPLSWAKMKKYNKQDVVLLEKVYNTLKPWMNNHPNTIKAYTDEVCHVCGSHNIQKRGFNYTKMSKYQRWQCMDCHSWSQGKIEKKEVV